jgi:DNA ligase-1
MKQFEPMASVQLKEQDLRFPVYVSVKIDGYRAVLRGGKLLSRRLIPFPNVYVTKTLENMGLPDNLDGEITVGPPNAEDVLRVTGSALRRREGKPNFVFRVFDYIPKSDDEYSLPYSRRLEIIKTLVGTKFEPVVFLVPHVQVNNLNDYRTVLEVALSDGYEGVMVRRMSGVYKFGRSTAAEAYLLKDKPFVDDEALVEDFEEMYHNNNIATRNNLGRLTRTSHQVNKTAAGTLGALICSSSRYSTRFNIGIGFDDRTRNEIWSNKEKYRNKIVKYSRQQTGDKDRPRHAKYIAFRDKFDLPKEFKP